VETNADETDNFYFGTLTRLMTTVKAFLAELTSSPSVIVARARMADRPLRALLVRYAAVPSLRRGTGKD